MGLSFHEKSLWLQLFALFGAFGLYVRWTWPSMLPPPSGADVQPDQAGLFVAAVLLMVVVLVAGHIAAALFGDRSVAADERDRAIARSGDRVGGLLLAVGVFVSLCVAAVTRGNAMMALVLLGAWVLAQAAATATQIVRYRRGG